ncbi:MAG: DUF4886 domain-containing protein [Clostridia bacterium]|nr:DUF4886 domain-containing protein [Clostridia bacterium]
MKRFIGIAVSVCLILSMLCGCSSQNDTQSDVSDDVIIEQVIVSDTTSETSSNEGIVSNDITSENQVSSQPTSSVESTVITPSTCSHQYSEKITQKAELFKMGTKSFTCSNCGDSYTKEYPIESIKLLSISNSYGKNALWELYDICKSEGVKNVDIAVMYIAGCSLDQHWENIQNNNAAYEVFRNNNGKWISTPNCTIDSLLAEGDWDVITTQNSSYWSGNSKGFDNLDNVADYIKGKCPNSKLIWHHIWSYQEGSEWLTPNNYNGDEKLMYQSIVDRVNDTVIPSGKFDSVAPVGAAIMNARTSKLKNSVHLDDGSHLSEEFGYYIAAFTWYCHLTGQGVYDTNFAANGMISSEELNVAVESAKNAIENPYKITQSYYTR